MSRPQDLGAVVGMTIALSWLDAEHAIEELAQLGFTAVEVHVQQLRPALADAPVLEAHATAAGELLRERGLIVSSLNGAGALGFNPVAGDVDAAADVLASQLRLAAALGAPRLICWDGRSENNTVDDAPSRLASTIQVGLSRSGLADPPAVSVELHPFTFALANDRLSETAVALARVGAGLCIDFCHLAVALGADLTSAITSEVLAATNHVHVADSDCRTSELHFPPGEGVLDVEALAMLFAGHDVCLAWDLFGWPAARQAMRAGIDRYRAIVQAHERTLHA